eukprot:g32481.t1
MTEFAWKNAVCPVCPASQNRPYHALPARRPTPRVSVRHAETRHASRHDQECQGLLQRLAVLQDENVMLRCRAGELASTHRTRGEGAVQEANAVLRAEVDSLIAELSATTTWKEEAAKRLVNQAAEIERLRHERLASLEALDLRPEAPEANLRPQLERSEQERRRPRPREGPVESLNRR